MVVGGCCCGDGGMVFVWVVGRPQGIAPTGWTAGEGDSSCGRGFCCGGGSGV